MVLSEFLSKTNMLDELLSADIVKVPEVEVTGSSLLSFLAEINTSPSAQITGSETPVFLYALIVSVFPFLKSPSLSSENKEGEHIR